jgi:two-component system, LytTR family, sensor kinase
MKSFHIKPGLIISLSIGCIFSLRLLLPLRRILPQRKLSRLQDTGLDNILLAIFTVTVFAFCCWLIHQYIVQTRFRIKLFNKKWIKGMAGILLGMLLSHAMERMFQIFSINPLSSVEGVPAARRLFFLNLRGFFIGGFQFFMVYYIAALKEAEQARLEIERLKQENLQARLNLLKQQISPHFLFNSLSTLKTIAPDNNTKQYIMQLSNVYRYLLNYNDNNIASVKDELAFTRSYLYILHERYEEALQVNIQIADEVLQRHLPPLALQILIENAIKHNVVSADEPLQINIYSDKQYQLTVENNLQPKLSIEENTGKGLQNISDRYQLLSGQPIDIQKKGNKFIVKLPLLSA